MKTSLTIRNALIPLALALTASGSLPAQTEERQLILEEVLVTAQKREETLQEVPLSINVLDGSRIEDASIDKLEDLQNYVPNLQMSETGISTQIYIRGIGTGNNQGFEQSVGQYVDGIYYGRQQLLRAPLFDLERVEVLRGPQSILFGKNSVAGALSIISAGPTEELEWRLSYETGGHGIEEAEFVLSGPIASGLYGRIALRDYQENGYVNNTIKGTDEPSRDDTMVRAILQWDITDAFSLRLKAERSDFDTRGRQIEILQDEAGVNSLGNRIQRLESRSPTGLADSIPYRAFLRNVGDRDAIAETSLNYRRQADDAEFSNNELYNYTLHAEYQLGEFSLISVTGFTGYEFDESCDCDFVAASVFNGLIDEEYSQFSQELRIVSPVGNTIDWVAGIFYQQSDLDFTDSIAVPAAGVFAVLNTVGSPLGPAANQSAVRDYSLETELWAVFAQATWNISDAWHLTAGMRYTSEDKDASRRLNIANTTTGEILDGEADLRALEALDISTLVLEEVLEELEDINFSPLAFLSGFMIQTEQSGQQQRALADLLADLPPEDPLLQRRPDLAAAADATAQGHSLRGSRSETSFTPMVSLQWDVSEDIRLYGSITTGFKAGGFDARANVIESWEFEEEEATAYELGAKTRFWNGRGELNLALYHTDYDDLQISQFDGTLGFNVGNARETEVQGVELDGRLALSESFSISYALAYLDHEFKDFDNGNCYTGQIDSRDPQSDANQDGFDDDGICSYTGQSGQYTPEYTGNLLLDYVRQMGAFSFRASLNLSYWDEQNIHQDLDPEYVIDSYTRTDLRLALESEHWLFAVYGRNIGDEEIITYAGNVPLSGSPLIRADTVYAFIAPPETWTFKVEYRF